MQLWPCLSNTLKNITSQFETLRQNNLLPVVAAFSGLASGPVSDQSPLNLNRRTTGGELLRLLAAVINLTFSQGDNFGFSNSSIRFS